MKTFLLNNQKTVKEITIFLRKKFKESDKTKAILGISGGIDSALTGFLCKKAGLDLYALILPYQKRGLKEAIEVTEALKLAKNQIMIIDITQLVDIQIKELQKKIKLDRIDKGNIMARQRMIVQYALARSLNGLVVGTENLSEYYLGYFTLYGDQACDISPIANIWKTQIYHLAECLRVPKEVIKRKPSADLWLGQTDEDEFGFTYKDADEIMYLFITKQYSKDEIIKKGFSQKLVSKILTRVKATEHKRRK